MLIFTKKKRRDTVAYVQIRKLSQHRIMIFFSYSSVSTCGLGAKKMILLILLYSLIEIVLLSTHNKCLVEK